VPRASAVQEAAQRPRRGAPARSVLDGASTVLCLSGREGSVHPARHPRSRPPIGLLIAGRKSEPVFGIIKAALGFRQFLLRGLDKVRGEWNLVTMAYNLKRLFTLAGAT
jgi:hypothetical protein